MAWTKGKPSPHRATPEQDRQLAAMAGSLGKVSLSAAARKLGCGFERLQRVMAEYGLSNITHRIRQPRQQRQPVAKKTPLEKGRVVFIQGKSMKKCSVCQSVLELYMFHADPNSPTGMRAACRKCESARKKAQYQRRKSHAAERG